MELKNIESLVHDENILELHKKVAKLDTQLKLEEILNLKKGSVAPLRNRKLKNPVMTLIVHQNHLIHDW